jgi:hypothetical protein
MTLGLAMQGYEKALEELITDVLRARFPEMTYLEIGVAHGGTLTGLAEIMKGACPRWRAVGVELPNGYSYNQEETWRNIRAKHLEADFVYDITEPVTPAWGRISIYLMDSRTFMAAFWRQPIHLALIDGCHGRPCVIRDFSNVEEFVEPGGYVLFHDFGVDQIGQAQTHCPTLDVHGACQELGLLDSPRPRPGWEFVGELLGDKSQCGANMGVFKRHGL